MKHKVGDIVKVREDLKVGKDDGDVFVTIDMAEFAGKLVTIDSVDGEYYHIEEDDLNYYWIDDFFEDDNDEDCDVDKIIKEEEEEKSKKRTEEKKSDEYEDIIDEVLSEMSEETKDILIKEIIKGENNIAIVATPIYETVCHTNSVSIQRIIGTKYGVAIANKEGMVKL